MKMKGISACHVGDCQSLPGQIAQGYPYFNEFRETDRRTSPKFKQGSLKVNLASYLIYLLRFLA